MSLAYKFFEEREKALAKYKKQGYLDLDEVLEKYDKTDENLLDVKMAWTTADLDKLKVTQKGKKFIEEKSYQLRLVKPLLEVLGEHK